MSTKNWKPEVQTGNDENWYGNALVFATQKEAEYSAKDLFDRWHLCVGHRAVETDDPVNYRIDFETHTMHEVST